MRVLTIFALLALAMGKKPGGVPRPPGKIDTVVILMLENRSFDHLLGFMKKLNPEINGCLPENPVCSNPRDPNDPNSEIYMVGDKATQVQITDPHHEIWDTTQQLYGYRPEDWKRNAPMSGFIKNYDLEGYGPHIMECFAPDDIPALKQLVQEFAVFDGYHASVPGPTIVNRLFVQSATSHGSGHNDPFMMTYGYPQRTIWESLDETRAEPKPSWQVFYDSVPGVLSHNYTRFHLDRFHHRDKFAAHAAAGTLSNYVFIEPRYWDEPGRPANDQHPDHDIGQGDWLIKETYEALRAGPKWNSTAFIIVYDEHGGFYDHVPPQVNIPSPDDLVATAESPPFDFTRLGVRVPFVVVSPWVKKGAVVHAAEVGAYEHSSIPATLRKMFAPDQPFLTRRDAWAATFDHVWEESGLTEPRTDCPLTLRWQLDTSHRGDRFIYNGLSRLPEQGKGRLERPAHGWQQELVFLASALSTGIGMASTTANLLPETQSASIATNFVEDYFAKYSATVASAVETGTV